jgi:hypothetical protein
MDNRAWDMCTELAVRRAPLSGSKVSLVAELRKELPCRLPSTALAWLLAIGLACFAVREANGPGGGVLRSGAAVLGGALLLARASSLALTG